MMLRKYDFLNFYPEIVNWAGVTGLPQSPFVEVFAMWKEGGSRTLPEIAQLRAHTTGFS